MKAQTTTSKSSFGNYLQKSDLGQPKKNGNNISPKRDIRSRNTERPYQSTTEVHETEGAERVVRSMFSSPEMRPVVSESPKFAREIVFPEAKMGEGEETASFQPEAAEPGQLLSKETEELLAACRKRMQKVKDRLESQTPKSPSTLDKYKTPAGCLSARGVGGGFRTSLGKRGANV